MINILVDTRLKVVDKGTLETTQYPDFHKSINNNNNKKKFQVGTYFAGNK